MGESDRFSEFRQPRRRITPGQDGNALMALLTLNIIFFILLLTIKVTYYFFQKGDNIFFSEALQYFEMPAQLGRLAQRPWTLLTYMFSHISAMNILSNMLWLWAFGFILQELTGNKKLIPVYIYGGFAGAIVFIGVNYMVPSLRPAISSSALLGANAATMAVAVATTTLAPDFRFFRNLNGGIPIWVLTMVYILVDFAGIATISAAYSLSHLAGAAAGFLFIFLLRKDIDGSLWMNSFYNWFINLFNPDKKRTTVNIKERVFYNTEGKKPYKKTPNITPQRVDEILDKINLKGYHLLTEEEKNILKRAAEEDL
ncbi:rhomboid family intramembrane serine protease [Ferruginibacter paludis]|uniref:rhomboid family intramembrane serine protease n=1 Tax=Ferruginibacter paludis TaxID=1310417 RepID=UPI0025B55754|nr:rhomboid family intramembrane serine protease [Ferruginibacter paludis]MDN3658625.1 rhomboid family intramembrane serine protease [Ferruginibacter paludis]